MAALLTGCGSFFQCEGKASCPTTTCTTNCPATTTNYVYASNSATGPTYLNGYTLASGTLAAATNAPFSLGTNIVPSALAITPANTYLYMATDANLTAGIGYIYGYSITTGGALSILGGGSPLINENDSALAISADGQWLFALGTDGITLNEYQINSSTGALKFAAGYGVTAAPNGTITPLSVKAAPSGDFFAAALGTGGANTFSFTTTTGVGAASTGIDPANASTGIYAIAIDSSNYLYCAGTAGLQVFSVTAAGAPTFLKTYPTGNGSHSIVINGTSTDVYVGNQTDGTITGYAIGTSAALTALVGSPYTAPTLVGALAIDHTNAYLVALGYNATSGIQLFSIGSAGALSPSSSAGSGTTTGVPLAIAATH
jgi:6-phosphogluconolactonase (cycloisomerase 2 family)